MPTRTSAPRRSPRPGPATSSARRSSRRSSSGSSSSRSCSGWARRAAAHAAAASRRCRSRCSARSSSRSRSTSSASSTTARSRGRPCSSRRSSSASGSRSPSRCSRGSSRARCSPRSTRSAARWPSRPPASSRRSPRASPSRCSISRARPSSRRAVPCADRPPSADALSGAAPRGPPASGRRSHIERTRLGRLAGRAALAVAVLAAALTAVPAASAHAVLLTTEPSNDAIVERPPAQVVLRFDEPVETAFGSLRVYDARANRVDSGEVSRPDGSTVVAQLDAELADGTYTATWRALSADGHPVQGAFVFHVGEPGANPEGVAAQVLGGGTAELVTVLFAVARFVVFGLLLLAVGGPAALVLVRVTARACWRRRLLGALAAPAGGLAVAAAVGVGLQGATAGGFGLGEAVRPSVVREVLGTRFGTVWGVQALLALVLSALAVAARRRDGLRVAALVPAVALVATPALAGHAWTEGAVAFLADSVHVLAGAVWAGALAFLLLALRWSRDDRWPLAARAVPRFSTIAVGAVAALVVAGTLNAYLEVRAWRGLWETTYGLLVLTKVALVLPIVALGAYNNRIAVPRLREGMASAAERTRFVRSTLAELGIFVAIVAVTAVLVSEPPARAEVAPEGPYATTTALGPLELNLVVDPARAGPNAIHLYLTDRAGRQANVTELKLSARLPSRRIGPLRFTARRLAPGHSVVTGADLALAGDWQILVEARRGEFTQLDATVSVPIRKD